jgi:GNAT superfamily N-acetyltransferase
MVSKMMNPMNEIRIRTGEVSDIPAALQLVKELARYEKAPGEVAVTEEEMTRWGFGPEKVFDFFVAEFEGKICGLSLYYVKYSTWKGRCLFLEDIIVTERLRRKGIGKLLFEAVLKVARDQKVRRLEWQVLEWNTPAIEFYRKYKSHLDSEWINCKLTDQDLARFNNFTQ